MKMNKTALGLAVAIVGLTVGTQVPQAFAQSGDMHRSDRSPVSVDAVTIKEDQAVAIAKTKLDGTVVRIHLDRYRGTATWKVKILSTDGTQKGSFRIDAMTGEILKFKIHDVKAHSHLDDLKNKFQSLKKHFENNGRR